MVSFSEVVRKIKRGDGAPAAVPIPERSDLMNLAMHLHRGAGADQAGMETPTGRTAVRPPARSLAPLATTARPAVPERSQNPAVPDPMPSPAQDDFPGGETPMTPEQEPAGDPVIFLPPDALDAPENISLEPGSVPNAGDQGLSPPDLGPVTGPVAQLLQQMEQEAGGKDIREDFFRKVEKGKKVTDSQEEVIDRVTYDEKQRLFQEELKTGKVRHRSRSPAAPAEAKLSSAAASEMEKNALEIPSVPVPRENDFPGTKDDEEKALEAILGPSVGAEAGEATPSPLPADSDSSLAADAMAVAGEVPLASAERFPAAPRQEIEPRGPASADVAGNVTDEGITPEEKEALKSIKFD